MKYLLFSAYIKHNFGDLPSIYNIPLYRHHFPREGVQAFSHCCALPSARLGFAFIAFPTLSDDDQASQASLWPQAYDSTLPVRWALSMFEIRPVMLQMGLVIDLISVFRAVKLLDREGSHCQCTFCNLIDFHLFRCESCRGSRCLDHGTGISRKNSFYELMMTWLELIPPLALICADDLSGPSLPLWAAGQDPLKGHK